jgi:periplasmic protein TonB
VTSGAAREPSLGAPITASVALHVAIIAAFFVLRPAAPPPMPPIYRVQMVAAPPGPPAIGVVQPTPKAQQPVTEQPPPVRPITPPKVAPLPATKKTATRPAPAAATPVTPTETKPAPAQTAPVAGGGETGGKGADVANVNLGGIDFPYPGYLQNIVRQIRIRFKPSGGGSLSAEVAFLIRRDGTLTPGSLRLVTKSGSFAFDTDARGAVEEAATARAFGPLPDGFKDDVLPVIFRFDPKVFSR